MVSDFLKALVNSVSVFVSLVFSLLGISLVFGGVFCLSSRVYKGSQGQKNP